jgi:hypothetical protein
MSKTHRDAEQNVRGKGGGENTQEKTQGKKQQLPSRPWPQARARLREKKTNKINKER